jgi:hypothetical protein
MVSDQNIVIDTLADINIDNHVLLAQEHKRTESVERMEPLNIRNEEKFRKIREILGGERKRDQVRALATLVSCWKGKQDATGE